MCGVVAYWPSAPTSDAFAAFGRLMDQSKIRGMHAYGIAQGGVVFRSHDVGRVKERFDPRLPAIAHARYSTSGDWQKLENNQPLQAAGMTLAFNGVISMGTKEEFESQFGVSCDSDNDGEVFLRLLEKGADPISVIAELKGSFAGCWMRDGKLYAARNERRPLWTCQEYGARWFASTKDAFKRAGFTVDELGFGGLQQVPPVPAHMECGVE